MTVPNAHAAPQWRPLEALAAWAVPGLGHALLGETRRGLILGVTLGSLYVVGFLVGGVSVFDHRERTEQIVGLGQFFMGPCVLTDLALQTQIKPRGPRPEPGADNLYEPSFGRVNEQGVLYTSLAGWLNILCILDVLCRDRQRRRPGAAASAAGEARAGEPGGAGVGT